MARPGGSEIITVTMFFMEYYTSECAGKGLACSSGQCLTIFSILPYRLRRRTLSAGNPRSSRERDFRILLYHVFFFFFFFISLLCLISVWPLSQTCATFLINIKTSVLLQ